MHQVVATDSTLAEMRIGCGPTSRNDNWRNSTPEEIETMIQPGPQHRGWMSGIFSRAEDNYGISGARFLERCRAEDPNARDGQKNSNQTPSGKEPAGS